MPVGNDNQAKNKSPQSIEQRLPIDIVELFNLFLKGDDKAALLLFNTFNKRIYLYCAKIVSNTYIAEDITQEVLSHLIQHDPEADTSTYGINNLYNNGGNQGDQSSNNSDSVYNIPRN